MILALLLASLAAAQLPSFEPPRVPPPPFVPPPSSRLTENHLLARAGGDGLIGHADTAERAAAAERLWSAQLRAAGVEPDAFEFQTGVWKLKYRTTDGSVLRDFVADPLQFPPKDEPGRVRNMQAISRAAEARGMTGVHRALLDVEFLLPTYWLLYKTAPAARPESEVRVRLLKASSEFDAKVFEDAGVAVLQAPKPFLMVYVGRQAGYATLFAKTAATLEERLARRAEALAKDGRRILAVRRYPLEDAGDYKFGAALYLLAD